MTRLSGNTSCTKNLKSNRQVFTVNSIGNTFSLESNYFPLLNPFDSLSTAARGISRGANAKWRPSCKQIIANVAKGFKVTEASIYKAARGPGSKNIPRWVAMYLCQELSGVTLQHIAKLFKLKRYGTVSTTVGKLKKEISEDSSLSTAVERLSKGLSKGK